VKGALGDTRVSFRIGGVIHDRICFTRAVRGPFRQLAPALRNQKLLGTDTLAQRIPRHVPNAGGAAVGNRHYGPVFGTETCAPDRDRYGLSRGGHVNRLSRRNPP
jgi:hypothetical protein